VCVCACMRVFVVCVTHHILQILFVHMLCHLRFVSMSSSFTYKRKLSHSLSLSLAAVESIVKHFQTYWRTGIQRINASVVNNFSLSLSGAVVATAQASNYTTNNVSDNNNSQNNKNSNNDVNDMKQRRSVMDDGSWCRIEILKQVLTQLLLYHQRFHDLLKKCFNQPVSFAKHLVPTNMIMYEIKKIWKSNVREFAFVSERR